MVGIDKINFYTPNTYIDLVTLAEARGIDPDKFIIGIGQSKMSVPPISQDTVTMGANAAFPILEKADLELIDLIVVGTESGIDESKSVGTFIHDLLGVQPFAKAVEIKQACYGATAGLMMAVDYVRLHPDRKALVIGSDISRYGLATSGEVTQGAGAIAMVISSNPRILEIEGETVALTQNIFDFWRPNYSDTAIVDGKFSNEAYISSFHTLWEEFMRRTELKLSDFDAFCFHMPYTKMGKKALLPILENEDKDLANQLIFNYDLGTHYTRHIGNVYTGSLYLSLMSLLNNPDHKLTAKSRIGFFSYGSGAVAEIFSGVLVPGFEKHLLKKEQEEHLESRISLSIDEYEALFNETIPKDDGIHTINRSKTDNSLFYLKEINEHKRIYGK